MISIFQSIKSTKKSE